MKKLFTLILACCGIYAKTFSQNVSKFEYGGNIGLNAATVAYSGTGQNTAYTDGFNAGLFAEYYISDSWGIKGKVNYDQKGWGSGYLVSKDGSTRYGIDFHLNYITVPVMANWHFGHTKNWYLNFGPYAGVLMNAKESSNTIDVNSAFNNTDIGLALGIGVKFRLSEKVKIFIEDDGQAGMTTLFKNSADGSNIQNVRSALNVGLNFSL